VNQTPNDLPMIHLLWYQDIHLH